MENITIETTEPAADVQPSATKTKAKKEAERAVHESESSAIVYASKPLQYDVLLGAATFHSPLEWVRESLAGLATAGEWKLCQRANQPGAWGGSLYRKVIVVFSFARRQRNRQSGYHGYHSTEQQGLSVEFIDYHRVPTDTTNAAVPSLDSKWTPPSHFSRV